MNQEIIAKRKLPLDVLRPSPTDFKIILQNCPVELLMVQENMGDFYLFIWKNSWNNYEDFKKLSIK